MTKNIIRDYFRKDKNIYCLSEDSVMHGRIVCVDGFSMSVQASPSHYSTAWRKNLRLASYEVGFPSQEEELLLPYAEDPRKPRRTVYGYVPEELINQVIEKHGGINYKLSLDN